MKVKPFYIHTAGLTEKQVGEAIDKCVSAGAEAYEGVSAYHADADFQAGLMTFDSWRFFGVDASNGTYFEDDGDFFGGEEITLDQLDEWLGLDKTETPEEREAFDSMVQREIQQPKLSPINNVFSFSYGERRFILRGIDTDHPQLQVIRHETPQQREERERLEAAIELHDEFNAKYCDGNVDALGELSWDSCPDHVKECYFAIVDKTGYRKAK